MRTKKRWEQVISPKILKIFPPRIQNDLKNIKAPKKIKVCSCYLHGKVDTGKTIHACFMLLQESLNCYLRSEVKKLTFISVPALFEEIKASYSDKEIDTSKLVSFYSSTPFLVLDDIGAIKPSEWVLDILYLIINNRYENLTTTIFTSNLNISELAEKLGDNRITSRIVRMGKIIKKGKY